MKYIKQGTFLFFFSLVLTIYSNDSRKTTVERPLVVVVCSYNNEEWSENTLNSIFTQDYSNFRVIIVDDCSTDKNAEIIQRYIDVHNIGHRVTFIRNKIRHRKLFNLYRVLYECNDDEIVIMVDGDDYLAHRHVLSYISSFYDDKNIWFTYGQYRNVPASQALEWGFKELGYCRNVPKHIQRKHAYRAYSFIYMHPRSFRAWLFKLVKLEDLIAEGISGYVGDFYPAANDVAMYFPMVEMAHTRIKFISDILYIRNLYSSIVGFKVDRKIQNASSKEIRKKHAYPVLFAEKKNRLIELANAKADIFLLCRKAPDTVSQAIETIQKNSSGIGVFHIFFHNTPENKKMCRILSKQYKNVIFIPYDMEGSKSLKNRLLEYLRVIKNDHVYITTDDTPIPDTLPFPFYIVWLEKTYAARFYCNRGVYNRDTMRFIPLADSIGAWKIVAPGKGSLPDNDAFLCNKSILYNDIKNSDFSHVYGFLKAMHSLKGLKGRVGLFNPIFRSVSYEEPIESVEENFEEVQV